MVGDGQLCGNGFQEVVGPSDELDAPLVGDEFFVVEEWWLLKRLLHGGESKSKSKSKSKTRVESFESLGFWGRPVVVGMDNHRVST